MQVIPLEHQGASCLADWLQNAAHRICQDCVTRGQHFGMTYLVH